MAMLAEPRQRKHYNLTPRGKALYEDDTRFGTKMLEKMGWSKGKGLGANEDGSQDFVRVRMRNTNEGLGFEDRDDHWTQHEQDFNGLLKTLNGDDEKSGKAIEDKESTSDEDTPRVGFGFAPEPKKPKVEKLKDKISGISLEQKSKLSKARVHYKKFTKGKDIAQYSEKDLANIFGKKAVETEQADAVYAQLTAVMPKVKANFGGVQTISTGLSVSDYFKQKMEALKNKEKQNNNNDYNTENKKKYKKRKREIESVEAGGQTTELISLKEVEDNTVLEVQEKKEKHKKNKRSTEEIPTETIENLAIFKNDEKKNTDSAIKIVDLTDEADKEDVQVPKNKKKKKCKENEIEQHTNQNDVIDENKEVIFLATEMPKKKKKSKKSKSEQSRREDDDVIIVGYEAPTSSEIPEHTSKSENATELGTDGHIKVKKNKKSKKHENSEENIEEASTTEISPDSKRSKKQKKTVEVLQASETAEQTTKKSKKSKKDVSEDNQTLTLDELIAKCNSYNIYNISSFVAEKFRNVDLEQFKGSTITHIPGYTHTADLQLNVVNEPHDEERITRLWNCSEDKYVQINPKAIFGKYRQNVLNAYKTIQHTKNREKKPLPLFNIKSLKRKSVFQPI
ncbi:PIN2/TERF1-interacting telomerase inhibitor 1 [Bactrocera neohumeralis]|uniref:PIN2/TERF1-interacting telomerase inhibitor 1 n=1 Tax=Bactrocera neohumeralis TaxID=98809 RepID=UPI0021669ED5|nr:PIN2/TERF1-interacting telomerase inhibitor 1 [Bactrocera neohumeralis]XP_050323212.1 PIN2/TERF1-interacting telomerase inhibitor 1 [Bactrocera neohumeralis]